MGKLRVLSGDEACRILQEQGFVQVRQTGSHVMMQKEENETTITVPVPRHKELTIGTLGSVIRLSGLPRRLFEVS